MLDTQLIALRAERDALTVRWNNGLDYLDSVREREGQDSPTFCKWFAEWEQIDEKFKRVQDRIDHLEMTTEIRRGAHDDRHKTGNHRAYENAIQQMEMIR